MPSKSSPARTTARASATPVRPRPVAGPLVRATPVSRMTAEQLVAQIARCEVTSTSNAYQLGSCLRELSQPKRYRDELGFDTFEALLVARKLPSRVTAFKLITVVSAFSEREVKQLGGTEKAYALARYARKQKRDGDPREYLATDARIGGRRVSEMTAQDINLEASTIDPTFPPAREAAKKASSRLGRALTRAAIPHHMRMHRHRGLCVSVHLDAASAELLVGLLARLRKLEKASG